MLWNLCAMLWHLYAMIWCKAQLYSMLLYAMLYDSNNTASAYRRVKKFELEYNKKTSLSLIYNVNNLCDFLISWPCPICSFKNNMNCIPKTEIPEYVFSLPSFYIYFKIDFNLPISCE